MAQDKAKRMVKIAEGSRWVSEAIDVVDSREESQVECGENLSSSLKVGKPEFFEKSLETIIIILK